METRHLKLVILLVGFFFSTHKDALGATVPENLTKTIGFIFAPGQTGEVPYGTGFFVMVRNEKAPQDDPGKANGWAYLITAKHVLQDPSGVFFPRIWVRVNKISGGVDRMTIELNLQGPLKNAFVHPDPSVDIAVVPLPMLNPSIHDVLVLTDDILVSQKEFKELKIAEGSDVFFTGMFLPHLGENRNYPIVRFGKVALLSDEKITWNGTPTILYLMETFAFGGNSGAPVFFYLGADREPGAIVVGPPVVKLAGVMQGFFNDFEPIGVVQTNAVPVAKLNSGIAGVVPAYLLHDILYSDELRSKRK